jgi:hypothetical protein
MSHSLLDPHAQQELSLARLLARARSLSRSLVRSLSFSRSLSLSQAQEVIGGVRPRAASRANKFDAAEIAEYTGSA